MGYSVAELLYFLQLLASSVELPYSESDQWNCGIFTGNLHPFDLYKVVEKLFTFWLINTCRICVAITEENVC